MPDTLVHDRYERDHDAADPDATLAELMASHVQDPVAAFGAYDAPSSREGVLTVTGVYGTVLSPVGARDLLLQVLDNRDGGPRVDVGPGTITPPGASEPLQCRVVTGHDQEADFDYVEAACTWADSSTVVTVTKGLMPSTNPVPADVDLNALAAEVNAIRDEVRVARDR